jgi:hypothetical protein
MSARLLEGGPPIPSDASAPSAVFPLRSALDRPVAMTYMFADVACPVCGRSHTLYHQEDGPGRGASYSYVCPRSEVIVVYRPTRDPKPGTEVPDGAVPMTWLADSA